MTTTPNAPLLRQVLAHIEANPDQWYQADFRCKSGLCFAGWAVELTGGKWLTNNTEDPDRDLLLAPDDEPHSFPYRDTRVIGAAQRAQRVLGLTNDQADALFAGENELDTLEDMVDEFTAVTR